MLCRPSTIRLWHMLSFIRVNGADLNRRREFRLTRRWMRASLEWASPISLLRLPGNGQGGQRASPGACGLMQRFDRQPAQSTTSSPLAARGLPAENQINTGDGKGRSVPRPAPVTGADPFAPIRAGMRCHRLPGRRSGRRSHRIRRSAPNKRARRRSARDLRGRLRAS
jgi:hypothetical protein